MLPPPGGGGGRDSRTRHQILQTTLLQNTQWGAPSGGKSLSTCNMRGLMALRAFLLPADQTQPVWEGPTPQPQPLSITLTPRP